MKIFDENALKLMKLEKVIHPLNEYFYETDLATFPIMPSSTKKKPKKKDLRTDREFMGDSPRSMDS